MNIEPLYNQENQSEVIKNLCSLYCAAEDRIHRDKILELIIRAFNPPYLYKGEPE